MKTWIHKILFLLVVLILGIPPLPLAGTAHAGEGELALLRIDIGSEARIAELVDLDLTFYERLYTSQGELFLIAGANTATRLILTERGVSYKILDPDAAGSDYALLYGKPEILQRLSSQAPILLVESSFAVARLAPDQFAPLLEQGLEAIPLVPRPLVAAASPPSAASLPSASFPSAIPPDPLIQDMVSQVSSLDLYTLVGGLSGEWPITIESAPYTISTRYTHTDIPIKKATRYASDFFQSLGLLTWYDYYQYYGEKRNVIAQQTGQTQPDKIVLLTAHLDSTSYIDGNSEIFAPGADDNASGSAALMHIAEILSGYDFGCTLRYALFTGEEQGMIGSAAYAADVYLQDENLQGVLNIDMLGYSTPGSPSKFVLHTRYTNAGDLAIANLFRDSVGAYGIQLIPDIQQDNKTFSDHSSFWNYNYPAVLAIEDWDDHTPYYHRTGDQLETLNFTYYTEAAKAALATFAHMGCLLEGQLSGTVKDSVSNLGIPGAAVEAWQNGKLSRSTTTSGSGAYQLSLQPGAYTIHAAAQDHISASFSNIVVSHAQTTPLNASLTPCVFVKLDPIDISDIMPSVGETVSFSASASAGDPPISYSWDFGDGQNASGAAASHTFTSPGSYWVQMTANNACGVPQTSAAVVFVDMALTYLPQTLRFP